MAAVEEKKASKTERQQSQYELNTFTTWLLKVNSFPDTTCKRAAPLPQLLHLYRRLHRGCSKGFAAALQGCHMCWDSELWLHVQKGTGALVLSSTAPACLQMLHYDTLKMTSQLVCQGLLSAAIPEGSAGGLQEEQKGTVDGELAIVLSSIALACKQIASLVTRAGISNLTGLGGLSNSSVSFSITSALSHHAALTTGEIMCDSLKTGHIDTCSRQCS